MKYSAIVLSAGRGTRMKSDTPKQYLDLNGYPVIYHSLKAFCDSDVDEIVLVTGADDVEYCKKEIVEKYHINKVKAIVPGGAERYDSVFAGLKELSDSDYVMIHDGARPMITQEMISKLMEELTKFDACVVGVPVKDTIKVVDEIGFSVETPKRDSLWQVQTPQCFKYDLVMSSYKSLFEKKKAREDVPTITDDAMVVEYIANQNIKMVMGDYKNIKITTPEDIEVAKLFLKTNQNKI